MVPHDPLLELRVLLDRDDIAKRFGLLTPGQWKRIQDALQKWSDRLIQAGRAYPARAYHQGVHQVARYLDLAGRKPGELRADRSTVAWLNRYTQNELAGAMSRYADEMKSAILYGLQHEVNPSQTASWLYKATKDAEEDWRLIARTETARANALGLMHGSQQAGFTEIWVPPHAGGCPWCRTNMFNHVFPISQVENATNYKRKQSEWVPCFPAHPRCRCRGLPHVPEVHEAAQGEYQRLQDLDLTDEKLDEMFDSSGQLRPEHKDDPRLQELFAGKTISDPYKHLLGNAIHKCQRAADIRKGFFDVVHQDLDPLLWDHKRLRPQPRDAILRFWTGVLGAGWEEWATAYIAGSATSYQWETGWDHPWVGPQNTPVAPDVDTHLLVDYERLHQLKPLWATTDPSILRDMLERWTDQAKQGTEITPGVRLDAFVRAEASRDEFEENARRAAQGIYDVSRDRWLIEPEKPQGGVRYGLTPLSGVGGRLADEHPDWVAGAEDAGRELQRLLDTNRTTPSAQAVADVQAYVDHLYVDRSAGFRNDTGNGAASRGNFVWMWLERFGPLIEAKALLHGG